jgi:hypothetical protein
MDSLRQGMEPARSTRVPTSNRFLRRWAALAAALGAIACGGTDLTLPSDSVAAKIVVVSGDAQLGTVGTTLAGKLVVRVTDSRNRPVENQQVTFAPAGGNGTAVPPTATTNADGQAQADWVLGAAAGAQQLVATATGNGAPANLAVTFTASATSSTASKLEIAAGNNQTAVAGNAVATAPKVKVTDANGNPVAGVPVTFAVTAGGGSVNPTTAVATGADGTASATSWTLGVVAGANTLTATAPGNGIAGNPATFSATGTVGSAGKLGIARQPSSSAQSGVAFAQQPQLQLQDAGGNAVHTAGIAVTAAIASGPGGTLGGQLTASTDNTGIATFTNLAISGTAGNYTLQFSNPTLTGVTSTSIALGAGAATSISANSTQSQSATVGTNVATPPSVVLRDANNNPVAGIQVTFNVTAGNGTVSPSSPVTTGPDGTATLTSWTLGASPGANTVVATGGGVPGSVTFNATGIAALTITTASPLPDGEVNVAYNQTIASAGGTPPVTWSVQSGSLPAGLSLNASTGAITGPPTAQGTANFTIAATDQANVTATKSMQLTIRAAVSIGTNSLPNATLTVPYNHSVTASNGKTPYVWSIASGSLPSGLSISSSTGAISGVPVATGTANFTVQVQDALGATDQQALSITVDPAPAASTQTTVVANHTPSVFGEPITFTATVALTSGSGTPTGQVTFRRGGTNCTNGTQLGTTQSLSGGQATSDPIASLAVGSYTIRACFAGNASYAASSDVTSQVVNKDSTTTTITTDLSTPSTTADDIQVSVTVAADAPGSGTPSGTVVVSLDSGESCNINALDGGGTGTCTIPNPITAGSRTVTANYLGDGNFTASSDSKAHDVQ